VGARKPGRRHRLEREGYWLDRADPESSANIAELYDQIGETAAADAWIAESLRQVPGNLLAEGAGIAADYARGNRAATVERALNAIPRRGEEHHDFWRRSIIFGCLAADELGRPPDMRAALAAAGVVPRDLSAAGFDAWVGSAGSASVMLRQLVALRRCVIGAAPADASRRDHCARSRCASRGADWEQREALRAVAAELRNERDGVVATFIAPANTAVTDLPLREGSARMLGVADDPRVIAHFAEQREQIAKMRAELHGQLCKRGLTLLPRGWNRAALFHCAHSAGSGALVGKGDGANYPLSITAVPIFRAFATEAGRPSSASLRSAPRTIAT
jgi:hypothetical protein